MISEKPSGKQEHKLTQQQELNTSRKKCRYCRESLEDDASICPHCDRNQNKYWNKIEQIVRYTALFMVLVACGLLILGYQQWNIAKKEHLDAKAVLDSARTVIGIADSMAQIVSLQSDDAKKMVVDLEIFLDSSKHDFQNKYYSLSNETNKRKKRNVISALGDDAITNGSRVSFEKLMEMANNSSDLISSTAAESEKLRVYSFYNSLYVTCTLEDTLSNGNIKREEDYSTSELIDILLNDKNWLNRVASARLLELIRTPDVLTALRQAIKSDEHLEVVRAAIGSFGFITGFREKNLFGFKEIDKYWQSHSEEILNNLKP